jgi:diguanylate cyclase (GGDEF)-like protein
MTIKLFIHNGPLKGRTAQIHKEAGSIGRGPGNDLRIDEPSVSKRHAMIFETPRGYSIEDLKSQNGTWLDGNLITSGKKVEVESGTPISLGNVLVSVGKALPFNFASPQACIDLEEFATESNKQSILADTLMTNRRKLQQVFEISKLLTQSLDIKEVYDKILDSLFFHFKKLEAGTILLREGSSGSLRQVATKVREKRGSQKIHISLSIVRRAINRSKAVLITGRFADADRKLPDGVGVSPIASAMCVPLITKAGIRGVIYVYSGSSPQGFGKEDLLFITSISNSAAVAIENALLHVKTRRSEEELRRARDELESKVTQRTSELAAVNAKLEELSLTDELTGLFNRRYLVRALEAEFIRSIRYKRNLSVLLFDIDDFKQINDRHGHRGGDAVLMRLASVMRGCLRSSDIVARYGGDEMAILLPETSKSKARELAEKLRRLIEGTRFEFNGKTVTVTSTIGIATTPDDRISGWMDMLDKADKALYRGKSRGKNAVIALRETSGANTAADHHAGPRAGSAGEFRGSGGWQETLGTEAQGPTELDS